MARPFYTDEHRRSIEIKIRDTALALFARDGYRQTSMRAIARTIGCSATALYSYFDSKEALLAALRVEGYRILRDRLRQAQGRKRSAQDVARRAVVAYLDFAMDNPALFSLMFELDQGRIADVPHVTAERRTTFAEAEVVARILLEATGQRGDANRLAHIFWVSAHGLATLALAHQLDLGQSYRELVEPVVQCILRGLLPSPGQVKVA